jgi:hypothetical protein
VKGVICRAKGVSTWHLKVYQSLLAVANVAAAIADGPLIKHGLMESLVCWDGTHGGVLAAEDASICAVSMMTLPCA